jgi:pyruvate dehydrogenase (quinone)
MAPMTKKSVSHYIVERLSNWGVQRIFGYTGDSINPFMGALREAQEWMQFVQVRHEEMAAFMACAHAKFTGELGVCCASAGPGTIHLLNGLYDAKLDNQPVVAIVGQVARHSMGTDYQQEVDLHSLLKDVAGDYVHVMNTAEQGRHLVDQALRIAMAERTVTCIILPHDVAQMDAVETVPHKHTYSHTGIGFSTPKVMPLQTDLQRAAEVLNAGKKVAILIGAGAQGATEEVMAVAERLGSGVAKALLGLQVLAPDVPYVTGAIGLLGTQPSWEMMSECDTLLMLGTDFPYSEFLPKEGQARGVQIDIRSRNLSKRYPMEVNLTGNCQETLQALLPLLNQKTERAWQEKLMRSIQKWQQVLRERAMLESVPLNPQRVYYELFERMPNNAIITVDTGTSTVWYAQYHKFHRGMMGAVSGRLASMGAGLPYAIAAKFAYPERPVIALVGDGAMQMNGLNELITVQRYWQNWQTPQFIVLVLNNRELNFVTWEMRSMEGDPKFNASQDLPDFPYAQYAESLGFKGIRLEAPEDIEPAWLEALHSDRPVVLEAYTTPDMPPLPPHITFDQAKNYAAALLKGDSDAGAVMRNSFKQMLETFTP